MNKEWSVATDRDHLIRGRHSRNYYKHADSWLKNEVEAARLEGRNPGEALRHRAAAVQARESMLNIALQTEA
jgi:hypothetical protein